MHFLSEGLGFLLIKKAMPTEEQDKKIALNAQLLGMRDHLK